MATPIDKKVERAQQYLRQGCYHDSLKILDEILSTSPNAGCHWELQGTALYATSQFEQARGALEIASSLAPLSFQGQLLLADCYARIESFEAAECIYDHLTANVEQLPVCLLAKLATLLEARGKFQQAVKVCRRAAELQPECDEAVFGLAYYMSKVGYTPRMVLPILHKAFDLAPDKLSYRLSLAQVLHRLGDTQQAYCLVTNLEFDDFVNITCRCCLQRLMNIFSLAGDYRRCDYCRARLQVLDQDAC